MTEGFDWANNEDVLVPEQAAVAVYLNPKGAVVLRQEADMGDDDHFVYIAINHIPALIAKLKTYLEE